MIRNFWTLDLKGTDDCVFFGYYKIDKAIWATGYQDGQLASLADLAVVGLATYNASNVSICVSDMFDLLLFLS